jgi:hypothetical protein
LPFSIKSAAHLTQTPFTTVPIIQDIIPMTEAIARKVGMKLQNQFCISFTGAPGAGVLAVTAVAKFSIMTPKLP